MFKDLEKFKENLAFITEGVAYIKLDESKNLEYIRIDNRKFTNINKMPEQIIEYSQKIREAVKIMREFHYLKDLPVRIPDFVIKYHPAWIKMRQEAGFLDDFITEGEEPCVKQNEVKTYYEWLSDTFLALGEKEYYPEKLNPESLITESVFKSIIRPELDSFSKKVKINYAEYFHRDFYAFFQILQWKNVLDKGDDEINLKHIRYKLDKNSHFPLLVTGTNKRQKTYDYRKLPSILSFTKYLVNQNPKNTVLKEEAKKLEKVIRGY